MHWFIEHFNKNLRLLWKCEIDLSIKERYYLKIFEKKSKCCHKEYSISYTAWVILNSMKIWKIKKKE